MRVWVVGRCVEVVRECSNKSAFIPWGRTWWGSWRCGCCWVTSSHPTTRHHSSWWSVATDTASAPGCGQGLRSDNMDSKHSQVRVLTARTVEVQRSVCWQHRQQKFTGQCSDSMDSKNSQVNVLSTLTVKVHRSAFWQHGILATWTVSSQVSILTTQTVSSQISVLTTWTPTIHNSTFCRPVYAITMANSMVTIKSSKSNNCIHSKWAHALQQSLHTAV